jgi:hypothetical protein
VCIFIERQGGFSQTVVGCNNQIAHMRKFFRDFIDKGANKKLDKNFSWEVLALFTTILTSVTSVTEVYKNIFGQFLNRNVLLILPIIVLFGILVLTSFLITKKVKIATSKGNKLQYYYQNLLRVLSKVSFIVALICLPFAILNGWTQFLSNQTKIEVAKIIKYDINPNIDTLIENDSVNIMPTNKTNPDFDTTFPNRNDSPKAKQALKYKKPLPNSLVIDNTRKVIDVILFNKEEDQFIDSIIFAAYNAGTSRLCCCPPKYIYYINQEIDVVSIYNKRNIRGHYEETINYPNLKGNWVGTLYEDPCNESRELSLHLNSTVLLKSHEYTNIRFNFPKYFISNVFEDNYRYTRDTSKILVGQSDLNYLTDFEYYIISFYSKSKLVSDAITKKD